MLVSTAESVYMDDWISASPLLLTSMLRGYIQPLAFPSPSLPDAQSVTAIKVGASTLQPHTTY